MENKLSSDVFNDEEKVFQVIISHYIIFSSSY